jgi:hypothetical protein
VRLRTAADITCSASAVAAAVIALDRDCGMSSLLSFVVVLISAQWCPLVLRVPLISLCTLQRAPFRKFQVVALLLLLLLPLVVVHRAAGCITRYLPFSMWHATILLG